MRGFYILLAVVLALAATMTANAATMPKPAFAAVDVDILVTPLDTVIPLALAPACANGQCYRAPVARAAAAAVRVVRPVPAIAKTVEVRTAFVPGPVYVNERRRTRLQQPRFAVRLFSRFGRR